MGWSPTSIAEEIHCLSNLTNIPCNQFRHMIISANKTDPLEFDPARVSEAHLFTDEGSAQHRAFDEAIASSFLGKIMRYTQCKVEPRMPPNLCYVAANTARADFEALARSLGIGFAWGIVPAPKSCLRYTPNAHLTWLVTYIKARAFNPTDYLVAGGGEAGQQIGDMRSDDLDWNGFVNGQINVQGTPLWGNNSVAATAFLNVPVLFAFQGGRKVTLVITRALAPIASLPSDNFQIHFAMHGYLVQGNALQAISMNTTQVEEHTVGS
jgi:hypothetical protein